MRAPGLSRVTPSCESIPHLIVALALPALLTTLVGMAPKASADPLFPFGGPTLAVGNYPRVLDLKDLNADGLLDLLIITENGLSIRLGQGGGAFGPQTDYPTGVSSVAFTTGDLNGDGIPDAVVVNNAGANTPQGEGTVTVYIGSGGGSFAPRVDYAAGDTPSYVAMGDFDGDGHTDLAVLSGHINVLYVFPGLPGGGLGARLEFATAGFGTALAVGDLNEDGRTDLAVGAYDNGMGVGAASVFFGTPGTFLGPRVDHEGLGNMGDLILTDMEHDGHLDIVVFDGSSLAIYTGIGDGTFQPPTYIFPQVSNSLPIADLDGDGRLDLIGGSSFGVNNNLPVNTLSVALALPDGDFAPTINYLVPEGAFALGDVDGDGRLDLAIDDDINGGLFIFRGISGGRFQDTTIYPTQSGAATNSVMLGDLDGDGQPDLTCVVGNNSAANGFVISFHGNANGTFGDAAFALAGVFPNSSALGDLNGDGLLDVASTNGRTGVNTVSVLLGQAGGGLGPKTDYPTGIRPAFSAIGDLDLDGHLDLVTVNPSANTISVLLGLAGGGFAPKIDYVTGTSPQVVVIADLDRDGRPDLAVANRNSGTLAVFLGLAGGGFAPRTDYSLGTGLASIAVGDLDGDGRPDVAVGNTNSGVISVLPGQPGGTLGAQTDYACPAGLTPLDVAITDLNGDGRMDIATTLGSIFTGTGYLGVFLGAASGGFAPPETYPAGASPTKIAIGDLDGDGRPEVAVSNRGYTSLTVLPNISGGPSLNHAPAIAVSPSLSVPVNTPVVLVATANDPDALQSLGVTATISPPAPWLTLLGGVPARTLSLVDASLSGTPTITDGGVYTITWIANDHATVPSTATATTVLTITGGVTAHPPVVSAPSAFSGAEGSLLSISIAASDPDGDAINTLAAAGSAITAGAAFAAGPGNATGTLTWTPGYSQAGVYGVTFTASNALSGSAGTVITIADVNRAPVVSITAPASGTVVAIGTSVTFTGHFTDDPGETHTAVWSFDALNTAGVVNESTGVVSATYSFPAAGVYGISLRVDDNGGASGIATTVGEFNAMIVVYDPSAGFVTGGGWILSPAGAYVANPALTGKANFGFVSKYKKGAAIPTGETEFVFNAANFSFNSVAYQWLVISGAKAQYKGSGTINATGNYGFMLTATDGQLNGGGGVDKIRMKIWDLASGDIVYDNQPAASDNANPTTALGGGSIVIHPNGGSAADGLALENQAAAPSGTVLHPNSPNPFNPETAIPYELGAAASVRIRIFDGSGRFVTSLVDRYESPGRHVAHWNGRTAAGTPAATGKYFVQMEAGPYRAARSIVLLK